MTTEIKNVASLASGGGDKWVFAYAKNDLFRIAHKIPGCHIAHCVSQDLVMNAGIAKTVRRILDANGVTRQHWEADLQSQKCTIGQVAACPIVLGADSDDHRWAFHLVTKARFRDKPRLRDVVTCLERLLVECQGFQVQDLALPHLGSGLDRLPWTQVLLAIKRVFADGRIRLHIVEWEGHAASKT